MLDFAEDLWNLNPASKINRAGGGIESLDQAREPLTRKLTDELAARGLYLRRRDAIADLAIQRAGMLIRRAPLLEGVILECVQELILLQAPDEQCDVSHSEPRWPHLILVSLPPQTPVGDLRSSHPTDWRRASAILTLEAEASPGERCVAWPLCICIVVALLQSFAATRGAVARTTRAYR